MYLKKGICLCLVAVTICTAAIALEQSHRDNLGRTQADGGAPTPPPIPWPTGFGSPGIIAGGGALART